MQLNSLFFRQPNPSYTHVSISLLPNSELIYVQTTTSISGMTQTDEIPALSCYSCAYVQGQHNIKHRNIPVLLSKSEHPSTKYILYFHAMSEDLYNLFQTLIQTHRKDAYDFLLPLKDKIQVNIILVEYPGYGIYTDMKGSAETITEDAEAVYNYFIQKRKISQLDIIVMGRSMGSGPACFLAEKFNPIGLVLISPYTSIRRVAEHYVGSVLSKLVEERFENIEAMRSIYCPLLVIHGLNDELIPYDQSTQLIAAAKSKLKQFHFPETMTHNKFDYLEDFLEPLIQFLKKIEFIQDIEVKSVTIKPLRNALNVLVKINNSYLETHRKFNMKIQSEDDEKLTPPLLFKHEKYGKFEEYEKQSNSVKFTHNFSVNRDRLKSLKQIK